MNRALTADERYALDSLLSVDFDGAEALRLQAASALAGEPTCDCGCGSVRLIVGDATPRSTSASPVPNELDVMGPGGEPVGGVILFVNDGKLAELEHYYHADVPHEGFPAASTLH